LEVDVKLVTVYYGGESVTPGSTYAEYEIEDGGRLDAVLTDFIEEHPGVSGDAWRIECEIKFDDFNNDYPRIVWCEQNGFQLHGLGPAYGSNQGRVTLYVTGTGHGPHGRGIQGNGGCLQSTQLSPGEWHTVVAEKKASSLHLTVNGEEVSDSVPEGQAFVGGPSGRIYAASFKQCGGGETALHGQVRKMVVTG